VQVTTEQLMAFIGEQTVKIRVLEANSANLAKIVAEMRKAAMVESAVGGNGEAPLAPRLAEIGEN